MRAKEIHTFPKPFLDVLNQRLDHLLTLHPKEIDLSLDRMVKLLQKFGNPHQKIPPVIHVAGTNGKGSVLAFCQSILEASGFTVHKYTSPHLVWFNERIVLAGQEIDDSLLIQSIDEVLNVNGGDPITFFEATTAVAFLLFERYRADVVLLETGLGGRLDATNVVESPLICGITQVGYDHMEFLGNTLEAIAAEKAGIIKNSSPVVIAPQAPSVNQIFQKKSELCGAVAYYYGEDWDKSIIPNNATIGLQGKHQTVNAAMAAMMLTKQKVFSISRDAIVSGLAKVQWPGRLQKISANDTCEVFIDGAHNEDGIDALFSEIKQWRLNKYQVVGVLALKRRKNALKILEKIRGHLDFLYLVAMQDAKNGENYTAQELLAICSSLQIPAAVANNFDDAVSQVLRQNKGFCRVVGFGSLYFVGEILGQINYNKN